MDEIKEGDKIKIVCKDGNVNNAKITHNEKELYYLTGLKINMHTGETVKATLEMISPILDIEATVSDIIDMNPKLIEIKGVVDKYCSINKKEGSDALESMKNIIKALYPKIR